jgi:hypothetical protein
LKDAAKIGHSARIVSKTVVLQRQAKSSDFTDTLSFYGASDPRSAKAGLVEQHPERERPPFRKIVCQQRGPGSMTDDHRLRRADLAIWGTIA